MPDESEEVWRYSGIDHLDLDRFAPPPLLGDVPDKAARDLALAREIARSLGSHCALVVTRGGALSTYELSSTLPDDALGVLSARAAWSGSSPPPGLGELAVARDAFGDLHDAYMTDAVLIEVAPKAVITDPVFVVHLLDSPAPLSAESGEPAGGSAFPRVRAHVGASADAGLVEVFVSRVPSGAGELPEPMRADGLVVPVTELDVSEDATLRYANVQILGSNWLQIALQASRVGQAGSLVSFTAGLGASYARVRTDCDLSADGARSALLAAYLGTGTQVHDFRTLQDHHGCRTRSELLFKGAVADRSHSVYSGLIRIARGAHGSDAFQTNQNLVLSEGAHADSVPNLDIDENDVRCSHASTVGPIDEEQRYYLESRGVEPSVAERLIVLGFFADLAARAPFEGVGAFVEGAVRTRLAGRTLESVDSPVGEASDG